MIRINSLNKYFNKGKQNEIHVINNVSLELADSGMVAIFGKSGCGKTTLLNVIGGLDGFSSGSLTIDGNSIRSNTDKIRNQYVGYIFQNYNLNKSESCFDNVADALRLCGMTDEAEIEERVMAALANVDMDKYRNRTPDTLSGGQQQRIAIARAIVKNPRIILADEPTGNLDEANTVMIMDLLRQIAHDHLVLLVTHEANLVDYYCDTVVELHDGKVVNVKQNAVTSGYAAKDKNHIYLGELDKTELSGDTADIEYYGDAPDEPIKLRIVNNGGKMYIQINTPKVQILDEFSEVKLKEGIYESHADKNSVSEEIDMTKLPHFEGHRFGRLFSLGSSIKSGYVSNFKNRKRGKKILKGCMCLFSAVVVLMTAIFGSVFSDIINAKSSYNHNVFYVYTPDGDISASLRAAAENGEGGIDYVRLYYGVPGGDSKLKFITGFFETFESVYYDESFRTHAVFLDTTLCEELDVVAGRNKKLSDEEMIITTKVADELLELSSLGYIEEYSDLIGLISNSYSIDGKNLRIAGIVESDESAIYLTELGMAKYVLQSSDNNVYLGERVDIEVENGKAVLAIRDPDVDGVKYPRLGEKVTIEGRELEVTRIIKYYHGYDEWLRAEGVIKKDSYKFFEDIAISVYPDLDKSQLYEAIDKVMSERYFEYYDYYYDQIEAFYAQMYLFEPNNTDLWLMFEKGIEDMKYMYMPEEYYYAVKYKEANGRYPTVDEFDEIRKELLPVHEELRKYYDMYAKVDFGMSRINIDRVAYFVNEKDYIELSKQTGKTDDSVKSTNKNYYYESVVPMSYTVDMDIGYVNDSSVKYTVVHSYDPDRTAEYLVENFGGIEPPSAFASSLITPDSLFENAILGARDEIITGIITLAVMLAIMSVCMYFIMRSSLMNRIKEVGIYRAIGVSKKNLVFKFFIEAVVLTTLTVFVGYLFVSVFLFACLGASPLVASLIFYPWWMAFIVLAVLYALSLFCGTLPITSLLRKTPSQILSKYDI